MLDQAAARIAFLCVVADVVLNGSGAPASADVLAPNRTYAAGHDQWQWSMQPDQYD